MGEYLAGQVVIKHRLNMQTGQLNNSLGDYFCSTRCFCSGSLHEVFIPLPCMVKPPGHVIQDVGVPVLNIRHVNLEIGKRISKVEKIWGGVQKHFDLVSVIFICPVHRRNVENVVFLMVIVNLARIRSELSRNVAQQWKDYTQEPSKCSLICHGNFGAFISFYDCWYVDCSQDRENAADRLHPSRPIYLGRWTRLGRMLAKQCPRDKGARSEHQCRDHSPVSICPSLLHGFPLALDRILPLGVIA